VELLIGSRSQSGAFGLEESGYVRSLLCDFGVEANSGIILGYYLILVVIIVLVALMTVYHVQIVHWLTPVATWLRDKSVALTLSSPISFTFILQV